MESFCRPEKEKPPAKMTLKPSATLPLEWETRETSDGATEMRIRRRGIGFVIGGALVVALAIAVRAIHLWPLPANELNWSVGIGSAFIFFALWCAYAREYWRMGAGYFEHHLDFGVWRRLHRFENARLQIVSGTTSQGKPYYRLYLVVDGKSHFIFERSIFDLTHISAFIAEHTGFETITEPDGPVPTYIKKIGK
jgi:hypothetical protein